MSKYAFKKLRVGQKVILAVDRQAFGSGYPTRNGYAYIPAGTIGTVGSVGVPSVTGPNGRCRFYACIDFPHDTLTLPNPHRNSYRVSAYPEDIK
jgi:hypothetical protein